MILSFYQHVNRLSWCAIHSSIFFLSSLVETTTITCFVTHLDLIQLVRILNISSNSSSFAMFTREIFMKYKIICNMRNACFNENVMIFSWHVLCGFDSANYVLGEKSECGTTEEKKFDAIDKTQSARHSVETFFLR